MCWFLRAAVSVKAGYRQSIAPHKISYGCLFSLQTGSRLGFCLKHHRQPFNKKVIESLACTSFVLSLALINSDFQSEGRVFSSMAYPWFWEVINACPLSWLITGWLCPLEKKYEYFAESLSCQKLTWLHLNHLTPKSDWLLFSPYFITF